jgi:hypothetical protein
MNEGKFRIRLVYRRIGGTLYKVRVFTSDRSEETLPDKVFRIIYI